MNVTAKELAEVSQRTGIQFSEAKIGLGDLFLGSGIDDALAIKVSIGRRLLKKNYSCP